MSEPTGGEPNPFADIIDLFREVEAANDARPADFESVPEDVSTPKTEARPAPATATLAVQAPRGGTPITPKEPAPAPSKRRRAVLLLPVALLAVAGGATAAVIHQHHRPDTTAALPAGSTSALPRPAATTAAVPGAPAPDPRTAAYSAALDRLAAAQGPKQLTAAAARLPATISRLRAAGGVLPHAEAAQLDSLLALCRLARLADYPTLTAATDKAAAQLERAAAGRSDVPDPSLATHNVVANTAEVVATRLDAQVTRLASTASRAELTAQLRSVAREAAALEPTAVGVAGALTGDHATRATADASALRALGALSVIDGDHLDAWAALSAPLRQALAAAGVSAAGTDVSAIDTMITAAQQKLLAWAAANQAAQAGADDSTGNGAGNADKGTGDTATQAESAIDSYVRSASGLLAQYAKAIDTLPVVGPGQEPSATLTGRFVDSAGALTSLSGAVSRLDPPAGMSRAQQALATLVSKAHAAATAGQAVASSAQSCNSAARSCAYGTQRRWSDYASDLGALGDPASVRAALTSAASTAKKAATAKASSTAPSGGSPVSGSVATPQPKPVV